MCKRGVRSQNPNHSHSADQNVRLVVSRMGSRDSMSPGRFCFGAVRGFIPALRRIAGRTESVAGSESARKPVHIWITHTDEAVMLGVPLCERLKQIPYGKQCETKSSTPSRSGGCEAARSTQISVHPISADFWEVSFSTATPVCNISYPKILSSEA